MTMTLEIRPEIAQAAVCPVPDRRPIYEWAHDHITELPPAYALRGQFDVAHSPWLKRPFESAADPLVRHTTVIKSIQSGGTLLAEIICAWRIANDNGPCTFTAQSDDMAAKESKTRLFPLLRSIRSVARLLPRPGPMMTQQEIFFPAGGFLILNSANLSHQQSQSIRYKINDEIWMPRWADVYKDACGRVKAFERQGTSHILDVSQGGVEGDWSDWSFMNGSRHEWGASCRHCGQWMMLAFHQHMHDDPETRAGVVWAEDAKREDGTYDEVRACETVRFVCPHCGGEHPDSETTRAHWRRTGAYQTEHPNPPRHWESFHWEGICADSMAGLVDEYTKAENLFHRTGQQNDRIKFRQKREARPWKMDRQTITIAGNREQSGYLQSTYEAGNAVPGEIARHMTIDKQKGHWWVEVGAWSRDERTTYRHLFFGRANTRDELREIQHRYGVLDWDVGQDRAYMPSEVDTDCDRYGWCGLQGEKSHGRRWHKRTPDGVMVALPHSETILSPVQEGRAVPYLQFDGDYFKDIIAASLLGEGIHWLLPDDANPLWLAHVAGEEKKEVKPGVWHWVETKGGIDNHGLDTSVMQLVIAAVKGLIATTSREI